MAVVEPGLFAMKTSERLALYHGLAFFLYPGHPAGVAELAVAGRWGKWILASITGSGLVGHGAPYQRIAFLSFS